MVAGPLSFRDSKACMALKHANLKACNHSGNNEIVSLRDTRSPFLASTPSVTMATYGSVAITLTHAIKTHYTRRFGQKIRGRDNVSLFPPVWVHSSKPQPWDEIQGSKQTQHSQPSIRWWRAGGYGQKVQNKWIPELGFFRHLFQGKNNLSSPEKTENNTSVQL